MPDNTVTDDSWDAGSDPTGESTVGRVIAFQEEGGVLVNALQTKGDNAKDVLSDPGRKPKAPTQEEILEFIKSTEEKILSWKELKAGRVNVTIDQWFEVKKNQKRLYRDQLLVRTGQETDAPSTSVFKFNEDDWKNSIQLEAIAEFYINFNDPFAPYSRIISPGEEDFQPVDLDSDFHLVLIDSYGGRIQGDNGLIGKIGSDTIALDSKTDVANFKKINQKFDTIYLDDVEGNHVFRILKTDSETLTLQLDGNPQPTKQGGISSWHIPAGVSGELPSFGYELGPGGDNGYDHYDGMLFLVKDGNVEYKFRWSSYSSRTLIKKIKTGPTNKNYLSSSVRGNMQYLFHSYYSGSEYQNYCFYIKNKDNIDNDLTEGRYYFEETVKDDIGDSGYVPTGDDDRGDTPGKCQILIHDGNGTLPGGGNGSAGCIVSSLFYDFRIRMIELYQRPKTDNLLNSAWPYKIQGKFWLIRPDELPVGTVADD
jgi:hypothetical protein